MAKFEVLGKRCLVWSAGRWSRKRPCQWLPRREKWFYFRRGVHLLLLHWKPYAGIWLVAERRGDVSADPHTYTPREGSTVPVRKRPGQTASAAPRPEAKQTSVLLAKLPALREWMVATVYDDGSERVPCKLSLDIYGTAWCVTLRDPNSACKLSVRGEELDKVLLLAEQLVAVEDAPWERDEWLAGQLAKKKKK